MLTSRSDANERFDTTQTQFTGKMQLEEDGGEIVMWSDDLNDLSSPKAVQLSKSLSTKVSLKLNKTVDHTRMLQSVMS